MHRTDKKTVFKRIRQAVQHHDATVLAGMFDECPAADLADVIEHLEPEERVFVFTVVTAEQAGKVLAEIEPPVRKQILPVLDNQQVFDMLQPLPSDDAVDILGNLTTERRKEILEMIPPEMSRELEKLLRYGKETAGGIMDLEFVAVPEDRTVGDVVTIIGERKQQVNHLYHVWVTDHQDRISGVLSLKDLLVEAPDRKIRDLMNTEVISVHAQKDQEEVAGLFQKHDLVNMPVVDDNGRLLGRITHDVIVDVIVCGLFLGMIAGVWFSDYSLGAVMALAGALVILNSGFTGAAVPFVLRKCHIDPALATGPFITTLNDVIGLLIYLGLLTLFPGETV